MPRKYPTAPAPHAHKGKQRPLSMRGPDVTQPPGPVDHARALISRPYRVTSLSANKPTHFSIAPSEAIRAQIAAALNLTRLQHFTFKGRILPEGHSDYRLEARLVARVIQPCSVMLTPVDSGMITEDMRRHYLSEWQSPTGDEMEMPEDDTTEPLQEVLDPGHAAFEALVLALPLFPRAPNAHFGETEYAPPGTAPLEETTPHPFAALAVLKNTQE